MRRLLIIMAVVAAIGSSVFLPAQTHAQQLAAAIHISHLYMTTEPAYNAFNSDPNSVSPPRVTAFPKGVANVCVHLSYANISKANTPYRAAFFYKGAEVRHGTIHTFGYTAGEVVLLIPADKMQALGAYKVILYVNNKAMGSTSFAVIRNITMGRAYMITAKAWNAWNPNGNSLPAKTSTFSSGVSEVGMFFTYTGMAKADVHYLVVYDRLGKVAYRSPNHGSDGYVPTGSVADLLPATSGHYSKGSYRTDLYVNGAMVQSVAWTVR